MTTTHSDLHQRLGEAVGNMTYRRLGQLTHTHAETVRRYMHGQSPSTDFLANLCKNLAINANWLLTGQGPMKLGDIKKQALNEAQAGDLLTAMANSMSGVIERIERLELYTQGLDTRLRASSKLQGNPTHNGLEDSHDSVQAKPLGPARAQQAQPADGDPAARVGRAVAKRSSADAD